MKSGTNSGGRASVVGVGVNGNHTDRGSDRECDQVVEVPDPVGVSRNDSSTASRTNNVIGLRRILSRLLVAQRGA